MKKSKQIQDYNLTAVYIDYFNSAFRYTAHLFNSPLAIISRAPIIDNGLAYVINREKWALRRNVRPNEKKFPKKF